MARVVSDQKQHWSGLGAVALGLCLLGSGRAMAQTRTVQVVSQVLGETRTLHVRVPANYRLSKRRYPVVVLLDGQARPFFDLTVAAASYDLTNDAREFAMPPQIVVGIEQGDRSADLSRNDAAFSRFVVEELVPYIDREYRTLPFRTLIGHSLGGRFALLMLCRAPTVFSATIAISPSVSDSVANAVASCSRAGARAAEWRPLVLSAGQSEPRAITGVERLMALLGDSSALRVSRVADAGLSHTDTPFFTIPAGLKRVFASAMWEIDRSAADSLLQRRGDPQHVLATALTAVSARVGHQVAPSPKWMSEIVRAYLANGPVDSALVTARRLVAAYPEELMSYALLADVSLKRGDSAVARTALKGAIAMIERLEWFDETQRNRQRTYFRDALAGIAP